MMQKTYLNNYTEDTPEFIVNYGSDTLRSLNKTFITDLCNFNLDTNDFLLVSKNDFLIGIVYFNKNENSYYFYPSKNSCVFSIVNLIEITLLYLLNINELNDFYLIANNSLIKTKISLYFNNYTQNTFLNLQDLKSEKIELIKKKYDQLLWI